MLRRAIAILLIFPLLGSQVPVFPHTHAGTGVAEPEDHAARPHVHLHGHDHHHHGDGHGHHHHAPVQKPTSDEASEDAATVAFSTGSDHDHDAVYLPSGVIYGAGNKSVIWKPSGQMSALLVLDVGAADSAGTFTESLSSRPPPGSTWRTPLYLRTLSLRI